MSFTSPVLTSVMALASCLAPCFAPCPTLCPTPLPSQDSRPASDQAREFTTGRFRLTMPAGWRQLTPEEARKLRQKLPQDMRGDLPLPGTFDRLGQVDRWLEADFDGRCVTVGTMEGEAPLKDETLTRIRDSLAQREQKTGCRYTWLSGRQIEVGPKKHPAFEAIVKIEANGEAPPMQTLELYVPTGGRTVTLEFRAFTRDWAQALPQFQQVIQTLEFAREPTGPTELSDRLQNAAIVGAIVGLILLVLYKWTRR